MGVACTMYGGRGGTHRVWVGKPEGKRQLGNPDVDKKILLKASFKKWDGTWTGLIWLRIGTGGRHL